MRAASATGAAASAAAARSAPPSAAGADAGSNQFSNLLVGATANASTASGQPNAAAQNPAPVNADAGSGSDASANAPAPTPAVVTGNATPAQPPVTPPANSAAPAAPAAPAAAVVTATTAPTATTASTAASASGATAASAQTTQSAAGNQSAAANAAAAAATAAATGAPTEPVSAQATVPAPLSATPGNAAMPRAGKNDNPGGTKGADHRATASDEASATAGQVTVLPMWLLVQTLPANVQDPSGESVTSNSSDNASAVLDGASAATPATPTPVATPAFAPAAASSVAAGSPVAAAVAAATAIADSGLNSSAPNSQFDGDDNAATSSDHTSGAATVANADLSALASLARGLPAGAMQSGSVEHLIAVPVSDQNWPRAVAAQVQLFAAANVQNATLRLSPAHLGPVEVHIDVQASQINVSFVAAHADTRSALEQALPTLRAMLAHGGLTLGQAQVQGESRTASQPFNGRSHGVFGAVPEDPATAEPPRAVGLIDEYA